MNKWIFLISFCFVCLSCKQKVQSITHYLDEELKESVTIKDGSYWVYKDSVSGLEDSVWSDDFAIGFNTLSQDGDKIFEQSESGGYRLYSETGYVGGAWTAGGTLSVSGFLFNPEIGTALVLKPFTKGEFYSAHYGISSAEEYFPNFQLGGYTFEKVYHNYSKLVSCLNCTDTAFVHSYYSINTGFVKVSILSDGIYTVKELERFNIKK